MDKERKSSSTVSVRTGNSYTVWFPQTRRFTLMKGVAWDIFRLMEEGLADEEIVAKTDLFRRYSEEEVSAFLTALRKETDVLKDPQNGLYTQVRANTSSTIPITGMPYSLILEINHTTLKISTDDSSVSDSLFPMMEHLKPEHHDFYDHSIEIFCHENIWHIRTDGQITERFRKEELSFLKGAVLKTMASLVYQVPDDRWMATFHASAVTDGKSSILFLGAPGRGKSTVAALLQAKGYALLTDDFVLLDSNHEKAWKLPLAISVKEGSMKALSEVYPGIGQLNKVPGSRKQDVRYLPPRASTVLSTAFPVKRIILISYDPDIPFLAEIPEPEEAIAELLPEVWVNPFRENITQFLKWFNLTGVSRVRYSDIGRLAAMVASIFDE